MTEWAIVGQAAMLSRNSAQSARTTAKKANVGNARAQARAGTTASVKQCNGLGIHMQAVEERKHPLF
jgi:hypothetical protein